MNVKARHSSFLRPERFVSGTRRREEIRKRGEYGTAEERPDGDGA